MRLNFKTTGLGLLALLGLYYFSKSDHKKKLSHNDIGDVDKNMLVKVYQDATAPITERTVVFPGDPAFEKKSLCEIGDHCAFGLYEMKMSNHLGTHIDFPAHVVNGEKKSNDYNINDLIGGGIIIEFFSTEKNAIDRSFVDQQVIRENDFVFFKTRNSKIDKQAPLSKNYVYIEPEAARALLEKKVRVVGIDYISVDALQDETLPVHNLLLSNGVLIVENLALRDIQPGRCHIIIAPINIPDMDGLPARVLVGGELL